MAELNSTVIEATIETGATVEVELSASPEINVEVVGSGPRGAAGASGHGVPSGGVSGQVLLKSGSVDFETQWGHIVHIDTIANWNAQMTLIGQAGHVYVYSDYDTVNGNPVPGIKIGDGLAYLIDAPFVSGDTTKLLAHIADGSVHITPEERAFWNNKVRVDTTYIEEENLIFTTN